MTVRVFVFGAALAALVACSPAPQKAADGSTAAPAATTPAGITIEPGWYETKIKTISLENPNIPKSVMDMMKKQGTMDITVADCVTAADAAEAFSSPQTEGTDSTMTCGNQRYTMAGGRISGSIKCTGPAGDMTIATEGTYTSTSMSQRSTMEGTTPAGPMKTTVDITATRLRACTPAEEAAAAKDAAEAKAAMEQMKK